MRKKLYYTKKEKLIYLFNTYLDLFYGQCRELVFLEIFLFFSLPTERVFGLWENGVATKLGTVDFTSKKGSKNDMPKNTNSSSGVYGLKRRNSPICITLRAALFPGFEAALNYPQ